MLRRVLNLVSAPLPATAPTVESTERQRLREALALRRPAEEALQAATAATARVRQVVVGAKPAESEAEDAARAAVDSTREWALSGARDLPSGDQAALDRAADAQRKAHQAKLRAEGAAAALPDVIEAEDQARRNLDFADNAIKGARAQVLIAEARPLLAELEEMQPRYMQLVCEVAGLSQLLDPRYGPAHPWRTHVNGDGGKELKDQLSALAIPLPNERDSDLRRSVNSWEDFARRLADDPEATL